MLSAMKDSIDPEELRAWALEEIRKSDSKRTWIRVEQLPGFIRKLRHSEPSVLKVMGDQQPAYVRIAWGTPREYVGFVAGATNYVCQDKAALRRWKPGIYTFCFQSGG